MRDEDLKMKYNETLSIIDASYKDSLQRAAKQMSDKEGRDFAMRWESKNSLHQCCLAVFIINNTKGTYKERTQQLQNKFNLRRSIATVFKLIAHLKVLNDHPVLILGKWSRISGVSGLLTPNTDAAKKIPEVHARLKSIKDSGIYKPFLTQDLFDLCPEWLSED